MNSELYGQRQLCTADPVGFCGWPLQAIVLAINDRNGVHLDQIVGG
jgi:hypothetical protein